MDKISVPEVALSSVPEVDLSSSLHRLMSLFDIAFHGLGKSIAPLRIERLASLVHNAMSQRSRRYHAMPHIFEISQDASPIQLLAIIFHDTVYVQVDRRVHPKLRVYLRDFSIQKKTRHLILPEIKEAKAGDPVALAYEIFNVKPGQTLTPNQGENEFLSALFAGRLLSGILDTWQIVQIMACIEATIPFRPLNALGLTPAELLYLRLERMNQTGQFNPSKKELQELICLSVDVSNRDLIGFSSQDPGHFLSQTWELLLEGNPILRNPLYTTIQYRTALQKVEGFFSFLKPAVIFRQFQNEPNSAHYQALLRQAHLNLSIGIDYIQTKLVGMAIHESLSKLCGGDGPLVIFRGDIPNEKNYKRSLLADYLDYSIPLSPAAAKNSMIYHLLKTGRAAPDGFDFLHSTLGAYLYERLDEKTLVQIIKKSKEFFAGTLSPLHFLDQFPKPILLSVLKASAQVAWSRRAAISELIKKIK